MVIAYNIGQELKAPGRAIDNDAFHLCHSACNAFLEFGEESVVGFFRAGDALPVKIDTPGLGTIACFVTNLRERNADLRDPTLLVFLHCRQPNCVPSVIQLVVIVQVVVTLNICHAHRKDVTGQVISVRIEMDGEPVEDTIRVTPSKPRDDLPWLRVPHPSANPNRPIPKKNPHLGVIFRRLTLYRLLRGESCKDSCGYPIWLVDTTVDLNRSKLPCRVESFVR